MSPETKRGIFVVLVFGLAALSLLSILNLAGTAGEQINLGLKYVFGWDKLLLPFVLILIGASLTFERIRLSTFNYIGLLFFFLSFNALLILFHNGKNVPNEEVIINTGGYVGRFLHHVLTTTTGFWGALVILLCLLIVSVLLLFNTSLKSVLSLHKTLNFKVGDVQKSRINDSNDEEEDEYTEVYSEDEELELEGEETEDEEGESAAPVRKSFAALNAEPKEEVLSSKTQRKVEIPINLLENRTSKPSSGDIDRNKNIIQTTYEQFGIDVEMGATSVGPTVTQFTLRPRQGVKLSRIVALQNDLALALAAHPIRIEAPIPGKPLVGIEVPNQSVAMVSLRELLQTKAFKKRPNNVTIPLGKDVSGKTFCVRIDKMPHALVAGATGSGKSVCLNALIISLLYQNGPDELKFIFVDPKRVELTIYEGIPHLLVPPITKADETINALKWAVREMERRLDVLSKFGARDLDSYNARAEAKIPKLVIVIDELADLMSTNKNEVESIIVRIAQMARAVGIHLILATQRPSVDVITGVVKANIPTRVAFAVASQADSRTILDASGAEKLIGRGDMLYSSAETSKPKRLQGPFVSEEEVGRIVKFLRQASEPDYDYSITEQSKAGTAFTDAGASEEEPLIEDAIQAVLEAGKASTSYLQRKLRVGYSRAARIIDMLEEHGIVSPQEGSKPREILIESWPPAGAPSEAPQQEIDFNEAPGVRRPVRRSLVEDQPELKRRLGEGGSFDEDEELNEIEEEPEESVDFESEEETVLPLPEEELEAVGDNVDVDDEIEEDGTSTEALAEEDEDNSWFDVEEEE